MVPVATSAAHDDDLTGSDDDRSPASWDDRPMFGTAPGLPWWGAVLLGFGLSLFGAAIDLQLNDKPTLLTKGTYLVACLAAVVAVRRKSLFTPMVQPPLIFAVVMPIGVISAKGLPETLGLRDIVLNYGVPVINGFPIMAIATAGALAIGIARHFRERPPVEGAPPKGRTVPPASDYPAGAAAGRPTRSAPRPAARPQARSGDEPRRAVPSSRGSDAPRARSAPRPAEPPSRTPPPGSRFGEPLRRQPPPGQPPRRPGLFDDEPRPAGGPRRPSQPPRVDPRDH